MTATVAKWELAPIEVNWAPVRSETLARVLSAVADTALLAGALALGLLHAMPPGLQLSPVSDPISQYALTSEGWLFDTGALLLAVGMAGTLAALVVRRAVRVTSAATTTMSVCCLGLVIIVIFPIRPFEHCMGAEGWVHWTATMVVFASALLSPLILPTRHRRRAGCSRLPATARGLACIAALWLALLLFGSMARYTGVLTWHIGGLVERGTAGTDIAIGVLLATWAWRGCPCGRGPSRR